MADPASIALYGFLSQIWVLNTTSGSQAVIDRVQSFEPSGSYATTQYFELGRKGPIGATKNPAQYRVSMSQNLVNQMELEYIFAGKAIAPVVPQTYNMGDILTYAGVLKAYLLQRTAAAALLDEKEVNQASVSELMWRFSVNSAITLDATLIGTGGKLYKAASTPHTWGTADTTALGGVHGKEARMWLTSGSTAAGREFRIQSMTLRASFPSVYVGELGRRANVGTLVDVPVVTLDFDVLTADDQPNDLLFTDSTTYYDLDQPLTGLNCFVRVFDPTATEGTVVIRSFKLENVEPVAATFQRAQVRGLSTSRYSLLVAKETTVDSGGLIVSNNNQ